tara:strand:+ start:584 stop:1453 length:870 start_codon:yes stop_codon:yes gene_type:complete
MSTDLSTLATKDVSAKNPLSIEELMAISGQETKRSFLPRLSINRQSEDEEGNALPMGSYAFYHDESGCTVYAKEVSFRPFLNRYQYMAYDPDERKYTSRSIVFQNWDQDAIDSTGTLRCGKVPAKNHDTLSAKDAAKQRDIKCYRMMYGVVSATAENPATKETVNVVNYPILWRATGTSWGIIGDAQRVVTQRKQPLMSYPWVLTTERAKAGGNIFYKPIIRPDFSKVVALTDADYDTLVVFGEMLKEENAVIEDEYTGAKRKLHNPSDDALEVMISDVEDETISELLN